ncbi:MAG: AtpZ/AtpI family protein [Pseudomonadota bacterium]
MPSPDDRDDLERGNLSSADRNAFKRRASDLETRLRQARRDELGGKPDAVDGRDATANGREMGRALRLSTELIGGIVVGVGLGVLFDKLFGTWPLMFILFFLLGAAAGMMNLMREAMKIKTGPSDPSKGPAVRDDDEDDR